jgi:peptidoglycan/LPS O-acetylase OafA/YrhL
MIAGTAVRRTGMDLMDRLMQWTVLFGGALILGGQYVSNLPYAVYPKSNFWTDSPTLVLIRLGICLVLLAGSYLWTEYCVGPGWSWVECLGRNSLAVYWVHLMLVYGAVSGPVQRALPIPETAVATVLVNAMMVALAALWQRGKARRAVRRGAAKSRSPRDSTAPPPPPPG